jgi:serine/threonine protein phosphatase PrpC
MRDEISDYVDLIRRGGWAVSRRPFGGAAIIEACSFAERAGIPSSFCLSATAMEYAACQNSEQMAVTLARRVGDPRVSPMPPLWPVLSLLLLGWRHTLSAERLTKLAAELGAETEVVRALAIVAHLFPELRTWLGDIPSKMPSLERAFAVPLAARKLVLFERVNTLSAQPTAEWRVTGKSWRGSAHIESGLKNQDAVRYFSSSEDRVVVLAVADGHGSGLCFRSDAGSHLAVETAVDVLRRFAGTVRPDEEGTVIAERARTGLAEELTASWRAAVDRKLASNPFTPVEWANVAAEEGWAGQEILQHHPRLAYGSTILAVLATEHYVLSLQLGDGDILFMDSQGSTHQPISNSHRHRTEQTASLSHRNAAHHVRVYVEKTQDLPALIVASTDGYAKSYKSSDEFLTAGQNLFELIRRDGFDSVEQSVRALLDESSVRTNGDDITIGLICRVQGPGFKTELAKAAGQA